MSLFERAGMDTLAVRQITSLLTPGKAVVTAQFHPLPLGVVETEAVLQSQVPLPFSGPVAIAVHIRANGGAVAGKAWSHSR